MKRLIVASSERVDLSRIKSIGEDIIQELRELYPEIPAKPKYVRRRASGCWMLKFNLEISITVRAYEYQDSIDPDDNSLYWDYIHDFEENCEAITSKYEDDTVQCSVSYTDWDGPRRQSGHATLYVFDLLNPLK